MIKILKIAIAEYWRNGKYLKAIIVSIGIPFIILYALFMATIKVVLDKLSDTFSRWSSNI